ncbi:MAG: DUF2190 family protein [Candidatus Omnitrophica bacterium]|nr:DUF2190 family protein [Candidatus Omnitrophota bacterium]
MTIGDPYYTYNPIAGTEVSSTFEGRHVSVLESDLVHVNPGDGLVDKGQPVSFGVGWEGAAVGTALQSANAATDIISVDTEGIWRHEVVAGWDVIVGQIIFITSAGVLVDWPPDEFCHIFGYALEPMLAGTDIIAIKVHWMDTGVWWVLFWFWWQGGAKV